MGSDRVSQRESRLALDARRYRYRLRNREGEVYVGPVEPVRAPGLICFRERWISDNTSKWGGDWGNLERIF